MRSRNWIELVVVNERTRDTDKFPDQRERETEQLACDDKEKGVSFSGTIVQ